MMDDSPSLFPLEPAPPPKPPRNPAWDWRDAGLFFGMAIPCMLLAVALGYVIARALHLKPDSAPVLVISEGIGYVGIFFLLAAILRLAYDAPFWRSLGWVPSKVPTALAVAGGVALAYLIGGLAQLLRVPDVDSPMKKLLNSPNGAIFLAVFGIAVAPLAEELVFRGFLQPLMVRSLGVIAGIGITSLLFGMLHLEQYGRAWQSAALISVAGVAFGVIRHYSGSTRTSIITHATYNGTLFLAFFIAQRTLHTNHG